MHSCRLCQELVPDEPATRQEHYKTHLIEVTDNNGHQAYTFECPRCGLMDMAWGGGRSDPQMTAWSAIAAHFLQAHSDSSIL